MIGLDAEERRGRRKWQSKRAKSGSSASAREAERSMPSEADYTYLRYAGVIWLLFGCYSVTFLISDWCVVR